MQFLNVLFPINVVTESGITMDVNPVHPENAVLEMVVNAAGKSDMVVNPVHPKNADVPIDVMLF